MADTQDTQKLRGGEHHITASLGCPLLVLLLLTDWCTDAVSEDQSVCDTNTAHCAKTEQKYEERPFSRLTEPHHSALGTLLHALTL